MKWIKNFVFIRIAYVSQTAEMGLKLCIDKKNKRTGPNKSVLVEKYPKIDKRTGMFIRNSRVGT